MKKPAARVNEQPAFLFSEKASILRSGRQLAALATRWPAPCVAFTAFAVSCPTPRIVFAQELRVASAIKTAPMVAMDFVVMTVIPLLMQGGIKMENATSARERAQPKKVHVIGCGAIAREILAVCAANGLDHIELNCLPAIWHNTPEKITPGLREAITRARADGFERIFIAYADCGTGGLIDRLCEEEGVTRIPGPHCYSFFAGNTDFAARWDDDITAFFLTDFLARQFEAFVIEPLGLDRHPELRDMYFGHYRKLVYLSQQEDAVLQEKARRAADILGLEYEYRYTGYGDLTTSLIEI